MPKIERKDKYPLSTALTDADFLLGTDSNPLSLDVTKSYSLASIAAFVKNSLTGLSDISYESYTDTGTRAGGNLIAIMGDFDDLSKGTKITLNDVNETVIFKADAFVQTNNDLQIGNTSHAFFATLDSTGLAASRVILLPNAAGVIGMTVNSAAADAAGNIIVPASTTSVAGINEFSIVAEIDTGTDDTRSITPLGLAGSALQTKVDGIEALADVTDATNVNAAGATMNTDTTMAGNGYFLDQDNMSGDDATKVASQQSIKKFVEDSTQLGQLYATVSKSAHYTTTANDYSHIATANSFTFTLLDAATAGNGFRQEFINAGSDTIITIDGNGSETIDGSVTQFLRGQYHRMIIECNGSNWFIVSETKEQKVVSKSSTYTLTLDDYGCIATSGTFSVFLPPAADAGLGGIYFIKNAGAGTVTVDGDSAETIDGAATAVLNTQYESVTIVSDASNWHII